MNTALAATIRRVLIVIGAVTVCLAVVSAVVLVRSRGVAGVSSALKATGVGDHLSLPWRPSADEKFPTSSECARCHPTEAEAWRLSTHARSAQNPLVHASICGRCHAPLGTQLDAEYQLKLYDGRAMPGLPASAAEGVTCVTCHAPAHMPEEQVLTFEPEWPNWRATDLALEILAFDNALGTFGAGTADDPLPVANESHASSADPKMGRADLCKTCHNVVVDKAPLAPHCGLAQARVQLLTTYDEWAASPYARDNRTCQSCHMPQDQGRAPAAVAPAGTKYDEPLPPRLLSNHTITGLSSDYLASGPEVDLQEERVAARLAGAATVTLTVPVTVTLGGPLAIAATVTNTGAGHELPTGFAYWSEAWLEVVAKDADGRVLFSSGDVDAQGWLRDEFNPRVVDGSLPYDAYLLSLRARLVSVGANKDRWMQPDRTIRIPAAEVPRNLNGTPIIGIAFDVAAAITRQVHPDTPPPIAGIALQEGYVLRFADTILRNGIPPLKSRGAAYSAVVDPSSRGPIEVSARLLIRSQWPWMLQQQAELPTPRPRPRVYEMASARESVAVTMP